MLKFHRTWFELNKGTDPYRAEKLTPYIPDEEEDFVPDAKSRTRGILLMAAVVAVMVVIMVRVGGPLIRVAGEPEKLEAYLEEQGAAGVWIYMGLVILQIIAAVVPGGPFEIAGGYLYGPFRGALICDLAMMAGSTVVFLLSRYIGRKFVHLFFSEKQIRSVKFMNSGSSGRRDLFLFLFFLIPGTPKDLLSYVAGLTDVSLQAWLFITFVGRFPAIYLSALSGTILSSRNYAGFILMLILFGALSVIGILLYEKKNGSREHAEMIRSYIQKFRDWRAKRNQ